MADRSTPETKGAPNLLDPEVQACPWAAYKEMSAQGPVYHDPVTGYYFVTRYEELRKLLFDDETFNTSNPDPTGPVWFRDSWGAELNEEWKARGWIFKDALMDLSGTKHRQIRSALDWAFTASRIREMDPSVKETANRLIDAFIDDGACDWVEQFAVPLPLYVIGRLSGIGEEHLPKIREWTDAMISIGGLTNTKEEAQANLEKILECEHFVQSLIDKLRKEPDETLLSAMVNTEIPGQSRKFDDNELHGHILPELFTGGAETTRNAVAAGMKILIERKDIWEKLKRDPQRYMKAFIEELLRTESPVQGLVKYAHKDTELAGVKIPKGAMVATRYAAANRDERHFEDPDKFDIERRNAGSHLTFGSGPHHCLGAPLARRELFWAFTSATERFDDVRFAEGKNDFAYHSSLLFRGLKELHIEFTPAKRSD